jgi:hypothetical protein
MGAGASAASMASGGSSDPKVIVSATKDTAAELLRTMGSRVEAMIYDASGLSATTTLPLEKEAGTAILSIDTTEHNQQPVCVQPDDDDESSAGDEGTDTSGDSEDSSPIGGYADLDLTHTRALASALGLLQDNSYLHDSGHNISSTMTADQARDEEQERKMQEYEATEQQRFLTQLLEQQAALEARYAPASQGIVSQQADSQRRIHEEETRIEMMEMLQLALESSGNSSNNLSLQNPLLTDQLQQQQRVIQRSYDGSHNIRPSPGLSETSRLTINTALQRASESTYNIDTGLAPEPGATIRKGHSVKMWNLDMSSPFVEYSPDAKAVLNRDNTSSGGCGAPMLALTSAFTRGDKISISIDVEYLQKVSRTPSTAAAALPSYLRPATDQNAQDGESSGADIPNIFSFGIALLDTMPTMGTQCFGKDPFTWGLYDDRRSSSFTQSATIGSNGSLAGVASNIHENDVLTLVLDLDPNSLTALSAPVTPGRLSATEQRNISRTALAGGNSKRDGKGCAHLLLNGELVHSFQHLDCDKRYVMGVILCQENCVRLVNPSIFKDSSRGAAALASNIPSSVPLVSMTRQMTGPPEDYEQGSSVLQVLDQTHPERFFESHRERNSTSNNVEPFQTSEVIALLNGMNNALDEATQSFHDAPLNREAMSPIRNPNYGSNANYNGGAFSQVWNGATYMDTLSPGGRNRNPQINRPAQPPGPSPAAVRLGARFLESSLAANVQSSGNINSGVSTREAMTRANSTNIDDPPLPQRTPAPDYSLLSMSANGGFSPSTAHWRDQQEQRQRHQVALRQQLESQQERERNRVLALEERQSESKSNSNTENNNIEAKLAPSSPSASTKGNTTPVDNDAGSMCCCCWELPKSVVLLPCRHMCVCEVCGLDERTMPTCPMCREQVMQRFKVFT